jgi:hypothetical protein
MLDFGCFLDDNPSPMNNAVASKFFLSFDINRLLLFFSAVAEPHTSVTNVCANVTFDADDDVGMKLRCISSCASKKVSSSDCSEVVLSLETIVSVLDTFKCIGALDNTCDEEYREVLYMLLSKSRGERPIYPQVIGLVRSEPRRTLNGE